eukprot:GABU01005149.1.p1 GENE.GABU01005149.1~~GABU01005149.1.p1  ORF type:complete len:422 (+),score=127.38 GABU01005149.1:65-1267(+)
MLMRGFEFNLIHNIYVPTEEELEKLIDVNKYHEKMNLMMSEDSKFGSRIPANSPSQMGDIQKITNPLELDINEITENIAKLPAVKNMDVPRISGMPVPSKGDALNDDSPRKGSVNLASGKSAEEIALAASAVKLGLSKDPEEGASGTPMTPSKSAAREPAQPSNKQLDKLLEIEAWDVSEWTEAHTSEFIQIYKRKEEDSPVILIKAYTLMRDILPEKVFRLIYDLDIRTEWDNVLSNMKIFGKVNENVDHMYSLYRAPIGISNRDFCQRRTKSVGYKGTAFIIHFESVDHPECPPLKGVIRAHTTISGYVIRPSTKFPGSTQMTIMTQTDIKGMVPKMIVNMAAAKAPSDWCKNFKKNADRLIKAGKLQVHCRIHSQTIQRKRETVHRAASQTQRISPM